MKLKFDSLTLSGFNSFKLIPKKRVIKHDGNKRLTSKLVRGVCIIIDGEFKIQLDITALKPEIIDRGKPDILVLDFTEESYNIVGVSAVFDRVPDKNGMYVRYIRNETDAKFHPGDPNRYVPFCRNWVCSGHIIRRDGKLMFDFNECIVPKGYEIAQISDDD